MISTYPRQNQAAVLQSVEYPLSDFDMMIALDSNLGSMFAFGFVRAPTCIDSKIDSIDAKHRQSYRAGFGLQSRYQH